MVDSLVLKMTENEARQNNRFEELSSNFAAQAKEMAQLQHTSGLTQTSLISQNALMQQEILKLQRQLESEARSALNEKTNLEERVAVLTQDHLKATMAAFQQKHEMQTGHAKVRNYCAMYLYTYEHMRGDARQSHVIEHCVFKFFYTHRIIQW